MERRIMALEFISSPKTVNALSEQLSVPKTGSVLIDSVDAWITGKPELDAAKKLVKAAQAVIDEAAKTIRTNVEDNVHPDQTTNLEGTLGTVQLSACPKEVGTVDMDKAIELLGTETFLRLAKISIGDLRKYLTPEQFEEVATTERTGTRRVTLVES
jgi:hypothetical protein